MRAAGEGCDGHQQRQCGTHRKILAISVINLLFSKLTNWLKQRPDSENAEKLLALILALFTRRLPAFRFGGRTLADIVARLAAGGFLSRGAGR